ncbi:MAG: HAD family hydrolase [Crenarchaeota archaeon]|nr:MAG: HAD family hydrolase [Thermoproteota archaeon]RDJ33509.1 MAG: HAD family hydrolase [Thermoproteota archaeon]RDJ36077.1 MAG: HAD family hydrolase [Thermoproteota archaeon]RDJ38172.1 MAG: HAD family hydrolase [Thermoproteota archaeon]
MKLEKVSDGIFANRDVLKDLSNVDAIIFDCDGVLIDITLSYDLAIDKTTKFVLKKFYGITNPISITPEIIDGFKSTGGFNDEVDLSYAVILTIAVSEKLKKDQLELINQVIENAGPTGISSVEKFLSKTFDVSDLKNKLNYPGNDRDSILYTIFDQLFYGPQLYQKLFGKKSEFSESGLIENDKIIVSKELLSILKNKLKNKIAITTGRGLESIRYSLKNLLQEFDLKNSIFLEDESRELAKPNPEPLYRCIRGLDSVHCLYVGDSMEDYIMAKKVNDLGRKTTFCGIIGTSKNPTAKLELFEKNNVPLALDSIHLLPKVLNLV